MKNADDAEIAGLVDVVFVGGPLHGRRVQMANPEFHITLEPAPGEEVVYCRRMVERIERDGRTWQVATYAPIGVSDDAFARMVVDAARGNGAAAPPRAS
jgi:hypothetical protein